MNEESQNTAPDTSPVAHTSWCTDHVDDPTPEAGWCRGDAEVVASIESLLTQDPVTGKVGIYLQDMTGPVEVTSRDARNLATRLLELAELAEQPDPADTQRDTGRPRVSIDGFFREGPDDRTVSFETLRSTDELMRQLRRDHDVCGGPEDTPVIILTSPDGDEPGNHMGSVALPADDKHLDTIERAFRCLESVRAGLHETGHRD